MSNEDWSVARSLELLGTLKQTVAEFGKKETQLTRTIQTRRFASQRKLHEAVEQGDAALAAQNAEVTGQFDRELERVGTVFGRRRERVKGYHALGLRNVPKRARQERENWLGGLQMRQVRAEQDRLAGLQTASSEYEEFSQSLEALRTRLAVIFRATRTSFRGHRKFRRLLRDREDPAPLPEVIATERGLQQLDEVLARAEDQLVAFRQLPLPRLFRYIPTALHIAIAGVLATTLIARFGSYAAGIILALVWLSAAFVLRRFSIQKSITAATDLANTLHGANHLHNTLQNAALENHDRERARVEADFEQTREEIATRWDDAGDVQVNFESAAREKIENQAPRLLSKISESLAEKRGRMETIRDARVEELKRESAAQREQSSQKHEAEMAELSAEEQTQFAALTSEWKAAIASIYREIAEMNSRAAADFPPWDERYVENWSPAASFINHTKFGQFEIEVRKLASSLPANSRLELPGPDAVSIPLALAFPQRGSLLFETGNEPAVLGSLNNIVLRLFATTPPGKISVTIIDPVGLGRSFAGFMHLADYEESLINRRIWTQPDQIQERLDELSEHIEKVIQMYLRDEYATITEYNEQAGSVAEKYHFLLVADFPSQFSETAMKRLQSIAISGPRCGIYTLIQSDPRQPSPDSSVVDELRKSSVCIRSGPAGFFLKDHPIETGVSLILDPPPQPDLGANLVHKIGNRSIDSNRVEVPFSQVAPAPGEEWTGETTTELKVAIGRTGATKLQYLAIGKGTRQHALFAGKTGSGKSTLFHVIITNLALSCSPEQVEFYLIDFKKGVEFKCYAERRLPHARVVAIESDREFALSVLQRVDEELKRRGDIFRKLGVQDLAGYKRTGAAQPIPRTLLIIDEFQEFFVEDDTVAQTASLLFDRIVRQGRAFGIHVLLGSQTLGGAYTLARATLGQMVIRVALQCNEADAYLIMDENNAAPRLLTRPGEGIYNDAAGALEGNSPFQVVWLPDQERDEWLEKVAAVAEARGAKFPSPIVFEGNAPADIGNNDLLEASLHANGSHSSNVPATPRCWLGAPNSIKGPTEAVFQRQSGSNLLIVGQQEEAAFTMLLVSLVTLAAQYPPGAAKFMFVHSLAPDSPELRTLEQIAAATSNGITLIRPNDVATAIEQAASELKNRSGNEGVADTAPSMFLFIHGLQKFKKLRREEDFSFSSSDTAANPAELFEQIINEGAAHGLHILASVDTYNNVNRFISRKALSEFEMRVVFQMSANDSASLIDSPKASNLGLHRALFFNEREGTSETFRPYAPPNSEWFERVTRRLAERAGEATAAS